MTRYHDRAYWRAVLMRALKTFCQTLLATGSIAGVTTLAEIKAIDWPYVLVASALAAVFSIINNIATSIPEYPEKAIELPAEEYDQDKDTLSDEWAQDNSPAENDENNEV